MTIKNNLSELENINLTLENFFDKNKLSPGLLFEVNLAIEEVFTNIVFYAFPDDNEHLVDISLEKQDDNLVITIEDTGLPFNPLNTPDPVFEEQLSDRKIGGLGIHLIKKMMDEVGYERKGKKNILTLVKGIHHDPQYSMTSR